MPIFSCPKCGATRDVIVGPKDELLSCRNCEETLKAENKSLERVNRKDEIDKLSLEIYRHQVKKDAIDLGAKVAGVAVAAGALAWSVFGKKEKDETSSISIPPLRPYRGASLPLTALEVEILMTIWEDHQKHSASNKGFNAGLSIDELHDAICSPGRVRTRESIKKAVLNLRRNTSFIYERIPQRRPANAGAPATVYALNTLEVISRPETALIVEVVRENSDRCIPVNVVIMRLHGFIGTHGIGSDYWTMISDEIGFAVSRNYVKYLTDNGVNCIEALPRIDSEWLYIVALAAMCKQGPN